MVKATWRRLKPEAARAAARQAGVQNTKMVRVGPRLGGVLGRGASRGSRAHKGVEGASPKRAAERRGKRGLAHRARQSAADGWLLAQLRAKRMSAQPTPCVPSQRQQHGSPGGGTFASPRVVRPEARTEGRRARAGGGRGPQQKALSPAFLRMSTTDLKANHSGISSPARSLLRNSVPLSFTIFLPAFLATLSCT